MKRKGLSKRYEVSKKTKDNFDVSLKALEFDEETKFFKPEEGYNKIVIVPFEIKSDKHPLVKRGTMEIGDLDYVMDIWVHKYVGAGGDDFVCLKKNYGKPCPICEMAERRRQEGDEATYNQLKPQRRVYYNVIDMKNRDEGIQVFETSHFLFEKELIEEASEASDDGGFIEFADIEDGKVIKFKAVKEKFKSREYLAYKKFSFIDRPEKLDESLIDEAISFDERINLFDYEELVSKLDGNDFAEPENNDFEERKTKFEEKEEQEEKKEEKYKCPYGHKFGVDTDKYDDCDECEYWQSCVVARDKNR